MRRKFLFHWLTPSSVCPCCGGSSLSSAFFPPYTVSAGPAQPPSIGNGTQWAVLSPPFISAFQPLPSSLWLFKHKDPGWNAQYVTATPAGDMWHYSTALVHGHHSPGWGGRERKKRKRRKKLRRNMEEEEEHNAGSTNDGVLKPQAVLGLSTPIHSAQAARSIFPKANSNHVLPLLKTLG